MKTIFLIALCGLINWEAFAATERDELRDALRGSADNAQKSSVYVYGDQSMDLLIPVKILGAVVKAGVHYIPPNTDLVTLLSLAGGTSERAEIESITIRRESTGKEEVIPVDLEAIVKDSKAAAPKLMANDTILVPLSRSAISDDVLRTMTIVTGLATVVIMVTQISK